MWRLSYFIPIWIFVIGIRLALILAGLVLIPLAVLLKAHTLRESKIFKGKIVSAWTWSFMYPWGNEEDGIVAGLEYLDKPTWFRTIYWSAIRNPANNLRFIPLFSCKIQKEKVNYVRKKYDNQKLVVLNKAYLEKVEETPPLMYLCWHGIWYSNFRVEFKMGKSYWRFWIGNCKVYPSDIFGVSLNSYRIHGAGPVTQFKRLK